MATTKNTYTGIGEVDASLLPSSLILKLSISHNFIRYFVVSGSFKQILYFGEHVLHHVTDTTELGKRLEKIFVKDEILQLPFGQTLIGLDTPYTLLPSQLAFMAPHGLLQQKCDALSVELAFEKDDSLLNTLKELFRQPQFLHLNSTFLHLLPTYGDDGMERLFINVASSCFDVIHFSTDKTLKMMNRYHYKTETDFIYFVLLYCEEMKLDRDNLELVLIGEVDIQSKIYDICYRYFKNISFIKNESGIGYSKAFERYPKHLHYNLYNLSA